MRIARLLIAMTGAAVVCATATATAAAMPPPASAADQLCVGGAGCLKTLQAAIDKAADGDVDSAMLVGDSHLMMRRTVVSGNTVTVRTATFEDVGPSGTALEVDGPAEISDSSITNNSVTVVAAGRDAVAQATSRLAVYDFAGNPRQVTVRRTQITGNSAVARSPEGSAQIVGGCVVNNSLLALDDVLVKGNTGSALAPDAIAQGGGIWNGVFLSGPPVQLTLTNTSVAGNALVTSPNGTRQGAGLCTTESVTLQQSMIIRNAPDQCFGCSGGL